MVINPYCKVLYLLAPVRSTRWLLYSRLSVSWSDAGSSRAKGAEAFGAYAIASAKGLIPEMENAARLTMDHPMTFEVLEKDFDISRVSLARPAIFRKRVP